MADDAPLKLYHAFVDQDPAAAISVIEAARASGVTKEVTCSATTAACVKAISSMSPLAHAPPRSPIEGTKRVSNRCAWVTPDARAASITEIAAAGSWSTKA